MNEPRLALYRLRHDSTPEGEPFLVAEALCGDRHDSGEAMILWLYPQQGDSRRVELVDFLAQRRWSLSRRLADNVLERQATRLYLRVTPSTWLNLGALMLLIIGVWWTAGQIGLIAAGLMLATVVILQSVRPLLRSLLLVAIIAVAALLWLPELFGLPWWLFLLAGFVGLLVTEVVR